MVEELRASGGKLSPYFLSEILARVRAQRYQFHYDKDLIQPTV